MIIFRDKNNPKGNLGKDKPNSTNASPEVLPLISGDYVKNAKNTGDDTPSEGDSWIDYWEKHTGEKLPSVCPLCERALQKKRPSRWLPRASKRDRRTISFKEIYHSWTP